MTTDNFTPHNGGECPKEAFSKLVDVKTRGGNYRHGYVGAYHFWQWPTDSQDICDITDWRLAEQPKQENEHIAKIIRNDAGQIYIVDNENNPFDIGNLVGTKLYTHAPDSAAIIKKLEAEKVALIEALKKIKQLLQE